VGRLILDNELIDRFDNINIKVNALIELCQSLQKEKSEMLSQIKEMEAALEKSSSEKQIFSETNTLIQSKMDQLLTKLDNFADDQLPDQSR